MWLASGRTKSRRVRMKRNSDMEKPQLARWRLSILSALLLPLPVDASGVPRAGDGGR